MTTRQELEPSTRAAVLADMQLWLERAVLGLNLCPFAKGVWAKGQIHWAISAARDPQSLLDDLGAELLQLQAHDPAQRDTTLLVAPLCLDQFLAFNDFLDQAEAQLCALGLDGVLQIASFHPDYQFAATQAEDITNYSNRAPYPTLHLLREASIAQAVQEYAQAQTIYERNMHVLRVLGPAGWAALGLRRSLPRSDSKEKAA